jgi:hypothetical protein
MNTRTKRSFLCGLILGALLASGAFFARERFATPARLPHTKGSGDAAHYWLTGPDFAVPKLYVDPDAISILEAPESIQIHRAGPGTIALLESTFEDAGITPSAEDAEILIKAFNSANAYTGRSACINEPGVLVRLKRDETQLDLLVCFSCEDLEWVLDEDATLSAGPGSSGCPTLELAPCAASSGGRFPTTPLSRLHDRTRTRRVVPTRPTFC